MTDPEWRARNRANWDERVAIRLKSRTMYNQVTLRAGTARPERLSAAVLGPLSGQKIQHLQCHFGIDSLGLAQNGADVVEVDFSVPAIRGCSAVGVRTALADRARFVVSDVYETASVLREPASFDRVFVSWGALCWLPDMAGWARVVAHFVKPSGWLASAEAHPTAYVHDNKTKTPDGMPGWFVPYLGRDTLIDDRTRDFADPDAVLTNTRMHEWVHPISDIFMALIGAGMRIDRFLEHDTVRWPMFDCLVPDGTGACRWPDKPWLPLSYSLRASKPA
jgi:SAM-dependent methyltransferase